MKNIKGMYSNNNEYQSMSIIVLLIISIGTLLLVSCSVDSLDEDTSGIISEESFYQTESDLEASLMAMYRKFGNTYTHPIGQLIMMAGDDITTRPGANKQPFRDYDRFDYSASHGWLIDRWGNYWGAIYQANNIIAFFDNADVSQEVKDRVSGQAHFMRGLSYYFLVRQFGGVPILTSTSASGEESRATMLEVYQLIENDLQIAESNLPIQWQQAAGKATSGAAKTVLASVYLSWASWPLNDQSKYSLAAQKAEEVINSNQYDLLDDFGDLWLVENDNSIESIFTLQYNWDAGYENRYSQGNRSTDEGGWNDVMAEIDFMERFEEGPRKEATFQTEIANEDWRNSAFAHPYYKKWTIAGENRGGLYFSSKNIDLYRYAMVLLIYAEAENMITGPTIPAHNAINRVRNRAGLSDLDENLTQSEFHEKVIEERAMEFAGEWSRWFDIVRNEMVEDIPQLRSDEELPLINQPSQEEHAFGLLPQREIDRNPNLVQNPEGNIIQ